ncbi:MAG: phosphatidylserine decarboxylase [Anaplasmataceae bacterium]|nr:phosphatidylserine decarboxylase [Anaplasmataceae bacterium]
MSDIVFIDRTSKKIKQEKVYGAFFLKLLYGGGILSRILAPILRPLTARWNAMSCLYGKLQKMGWSRCKIIPFIRRFDVDPTEFLEPVDSYRSFNDFFIRRLKTEARSIAPGNDVAILPADGRYLVFENISKCDGFLVKGVKFSLEEFILDPELKELYREGSMAIGRLCPSDYHRFHFPVHCLPQSPRQIDGSLYSVNPIALKRDIRIFTKNKREMTLLLSKAFGRVLFVEVGATYVGTIHQTFIQGEPYAKGDEKGYFSFGGSCLVLFFEPGRIQFDQDLLEASQKKMEVRGLMGQTLGRSLTPF